MVPRPVGNKKNKINVPLYNPDYESELRTIGAYYSNRYLLSILSEITVTDRALAGNARIRFCLGYLLLLMKRSVNLMVTVVGVRFRRAGKIYYFNPGALPLASGGMGV